MGEGESDCYMWFADDPDGGGAVLPVGETKDEWFAKVNGFRVYSYKMSADYAVESVTSSEPEEPVKGPTRPSYGATQTVSLRPAPRSSSEKAQFSNLEVLRSVDLASVDLYRNCTEEKEIPTAVIASRILTGEPIMYLQYVFRKLKVVKIEWNSTSTGGADRPDETVSFEYRSMASQYIQILQDGTAGTKKPCWVWNDSGRTPSKDAVDTYNYFVRPGESPEGWKSRQG